MGAPSHPCSPETSGPSLKGLHVSRSHSHLLSLSLSVLHLLKVLSRIFFHCFSFSSSSSSLRNLSHVHSKRLVLRHIQQSLQRESLFFLFFFTKTKVQSLLFLSSIFYLEGRSCRSLSLSRSHHPSTKNNNVKDIYTLHKTVKMQYSTLTLAALAGVAQGMSSTYHTASGSKHSNMCLPL